MALSTPLFRQAFRIDVHHHHASPAFVAEITMRQTGQHALIAQMPNGPVHELRRFFYDTGFSANAYALSSLLQLVPVSQVMYGTDFPFRGCVENTEGLKAYGFDENDLRAIERDNAIRIMPQLE